jgi:hypothetical protein
MQALKLKSKHKTEELKTRPQSMQKKLGVKLPIWVLILNHSFDHNLSFEYSNEECEPIFNI